MVYVKAFLVDGLICAIGQMLLSLTKLTSARILVLFVVAGVVLGAAGVYEPLVKWAGAGATIPLTGFGYALAKGAKEMARQQGIIGALSGGLKATSPGIAAAILFGWLNAVLFRPKTKR